MKQEGREEEAAERLVCSPVLLVRNQEKLVCLRFWTKPYSFKI